jgi:hypothetical protein
VTVASLLLSEEPSPSFDVDRIRADVETAGVMIDEVASAIDRLVEQGFGHGVRDDAMQHLFKACVQLYAQKVDAGQRVLPCGDARELGATSVMVTASGLLKSANLELFELGMWQSFSGTR